MSKKIINFDREFVWHPYASSEDKNPLYNVVKAKGCKIYLDSGKALIDGMSSWWCVIHGYNNPKINDAMIKQIKKFFFRWRAFCIPILNRKFHCNLN